MSTAGHMAAYGIAALEHQRKRGSRSCVTSGPAASIAIIEAWCELQGYHHYRVEMGDLRVDFKNCGRHGCPLDPEDGHCPHCALEQSVAYWKEEAGGS